MTLLAVADLLLTFVRDSATLQGKLQRTQHENVTGKVDAASLCILDRLEIIVAGVTASSQQNNQLLDGTQHITYDIPASPRFKTNLIYV